MSHGEAPPSIVGDAADFELPDMLLETEVGYAGLGGSRHVDSLESAQTGNQTAMPLPSVDLLIGTSGH